MVQLLLGTAGMTTSAIYTSCTSRVADEVTTEVWAKSDTLDAGQAKKLTLVVWIEDGRVTSVESSVQTVRHLTGKRAHA